MPFAAFLDVRTNLTPTSCPYLNPSIVSDPILYSNVWNHSIPASLLIWLSPAMRKGPKQGQWQGHPLSKAGRGNCNVPLKVSWLAHEMSWEGCCSLFRCWAQGWEEIMRFSRSWEELVHRDTRQHSTGESKYSTGHMTRSNMCVLTYWCLCFIKEIYTKLTELSCIAQATTNHTTVKLLLLLKQGLSV